MGFVGIQLLGRSFKGLFPTPGQIPPLWVILAVSLRWQEAAHTTLYSHNTLEIERKHLCFFSYKITEGKFQNFCSGKLHISLLCPKREKTVFQTFCCYLKNIFGHIQWLSTLSMLHFLKKGTDKGWGSAALMKLTDTEPRFKTPFPLFSLGPYITLL